MTKTITFRVTLLFVLFLFGLSTILMPLAASAHEDEEHDTTEGKIEKMEAIVTLLEYLQELLEVQIESAGHVPVSKAMHDMEHDAHAKMDVSGIHIMPDGSVMLGSGEVLADATVNDDGMIVLADGALVAPEMDMRTASEEEMEGSEVDHVHEETEEHDGKLSIRFEIHDGMTHVHMTDTEGELTTFFVNSDIDDEDEVIAEIVTETGLTEEEVTDASDFEDVTIHE